MSSSSLDSRLVTVEQYGKPRSRTLQVQRASMDILLNSNLYQKTMEGYVNTLTSKRALFSIWSPNRTETPARSHVLNMIVSDIVAANTCRHFLHHVVLRPSLSDPFVAMRVLTVILEILQRLEASHMEDFYNVLPFIEEIHLRYSDIGYFVSHGLYGPYVRLVPHVASIVIETLQFHRIFDGFDGNISLHTFASGLFVSARLLPFPYSKPEFISTEISLHDIHSLLTQMARPNSLHLVETILAAIRATSVAISDENLRKSARNSADPALWWMFSSIFKLYCHVYSLLAYLIRIRPDVDIAKDSSTAICSEETTQDCGNSCENSGKATNKGKCRKGATNDVFDQYRMWEACMDQLLARMEYCRPASTKKIRVPKLGHQDIDLLLMPLLTTLHTHSRGSHDYSREEIAEPKSENLHSDALEYKLVKKGDETSRRASWKSWLTSWIVPTTTSRSPSATSPQLKIEPVRPVNACQPPRSSAKSDVASPESSYSPRSVPIARRSFSGYPLGGTSPYSTSLPFIPSIPIRYSPKSKKRTSDFNTRAARSLGEARQSARILSQTSSGQNASQTTLDDRDTTCGDENSDYSDENGVSEGCGDYGFNEETTACPIPLGMEANHDFSSKFRSKSFSG
eukprot:Rmarinus@m.11165